MPARLPLLHVHAMKKLPAAQLTANTPFRRECDPWAILLLAVTNIATAEPRDVFINLFMHTNPEDRRHETPIQFSLAYLRENALWDAIGGPLSMTPQSLFWQQPPSPGSQLQKGLMPT